jgi:hypothetical protein
MAENNATCSICDKGYYLCLSCKDAIKLAPYKVHCCSADCYKVFQVIRGFSTGVYAKEEFKSKLKNLDLSNLENYREHIKAIIKDALKEEKSVVKAAEKIEPVAKNAKSAKFIRADKVDEINKAEVAEAEEEVVEKPIISRKRNYKVDTE